MSLPTWKCGLKRDSLRVSEKFGKVTSYLEVWIETLLFGIFIPRHQSHFLLGSVD